MDDLMVKAISIMLPETSMLLLLSKTFLYEIHLGSMLIHPRAIPSNEDCGTPSESGKAITKCDFL